MEKILIRIIIKISAGVEGKKNLPGKALLWAMRAEKSVMEKNVDMDALNSTPLQC